MGALEQDGHSFALAKRARKWLDPASDSYIGTWIGHSASYWDWYGELERIVREGGRFEIHREPAEGEDYCASTSPASTRLRACPRAKSPRRSACRRDPPPCSTWPARTAGSSAELCRRHDTLTATVVDLPGSARVGRELIARAGVGERVVQREGDMFEADLGGPYDGALMFDIIHNLSGEQLLALLSRVRAAMKPSGTVAVLDMFRSDARRQPASAAALGLLFHLTSGADLHSPEELHRYMVEARFSAPKRTRIRRILDQALYQAAAV